MQEFLPGIRIHAALLNVSDQIVAEKTCYAGNVLAGEVLRMTAKEKILLVDDSKTELHHLSELLGKRDNDALRPADVAKPVRVLVLHHFAHELGPVGAQARNDIVDVVDGAGSVPAGGC